MGVRYLSAQQKADAFEALAQQAEKQVWFICLHRMGNRQDAEDCMQETMLKAFRAFETFDPDRSFRAWISVIADNTCLDALRARKKKTAVSLDEMREEVGFDPPSREAGPAEQLEKKEHRQVTWEAISALPPDMRDVLLGYFLYEKSYEEMARELGIAVGTVKSRLSRAREKLRDQVKKRMEQI